MIGRMRDRAASLLRRRRPLRGGAQRDLRPFQERLLDVVVVIDVVHLMPSFQR